MVRYVHTNYFMWDVQGQERIYRLLLIKKIFKLLKIHLLINLSNVDLM